MFADILQGAGYIIIGSGLRHTVSLNLCHNGKELMEQGFMAQLAFPESAAVFCIEEV